MSIFQKIDKFLIAILITSTLFILVYNIFHYTPMLGYDAEAHFAYVDHISRYMPKSLNLPDEVDSREFFNPPLGYIVPAVGQVICRNTIKSADFLKDCRPIYGTFTQVIQSLMYLFTIFINLKTLKMLNHSKNIFNLSYLILISLLAVNYRTISMIRGEPYILFFLSIFLYFILKHEKQKFVFSLKYSLIFGVVIACLTLSRQWAIFLFPAIMFLLIWPKIQSINDYFKTWLFSSFIGFILSSWFYFSLYIRYGSFAAFNMNKPNFSIFNLPLSFYLPDFNQLTYVFSNPIRPNLDNQFLSILYSDLWGDYWGYFSFTSKFLQIGRQQATIGNYFGHVNLISVLSTFIILFFFIQTIKTHKESFLINYIKLSVLFSLIGYLIFVISFPTTTGDTIKATYIIQMFHLLVFCAAISLEKLKNSNFKKYYFVIFILFATYFFNYQTFLSHFPINFLPS